MCSYWLVRTDGWNDVVAIFPFGDVTIIITITITGCLPWQSDSSQQKRISQVLWFSAIDAVCNCSCCCLIISPVCTTDDQWQQPVFHVAHVFFAPSSPTQYTPLGVPLHYQIYTGNKSTSFAIAPFSNDGFIALLRVCQPVSPPTYLVDHGVRHIISRRLLKGRGEGADSWISAEEGTGQIYLWLTSWHAGELGQIHWRPRPTSCMLHVH